MIICIYIYIYIHIYIVPIFSMNIGAMISVPLDLLVALIA